MSFAQNGTVVFTATINDACATDLNGVTARTDSVVASAYRVRIPTDLALWHPRTMHHHLHGLDRAIRDKLVTGITLESRVCPDPICEPCLAGKMHAHPFSSTGTITTGILDLIHSDLVQMPTASMSGYRYFIAFHDDASSYHAAYLLKKKSEAFNAFLMFKAYAENQTGCKIKAFQDDKGGEFMSNEFTDFIAKADIVPHHTTRNRPQQNGVAEHTNCTIVEAITAALAESGLPHSFWVECLPSFIHVWTHLPLSSLAARNTATMPHELWFGVKPDLAHLHVWGCHAYHHVQRDFRGKLDWHMIPCIFVSYPVDYSSWRLWDPAERKIIITKNAQFDERYFPLSKLATGTLVLICSPSIISKTPPSLPTMSDTQVLDLGGVDDSQRRKRRLSRSASPPPVRVQPAPARALPPIVPQPLPQTPEMTLMSPTPGPVELDVISPKIVLGCCSGRQCNAPKDWCAAVAPSHKLSSLLTPKQETVSPPLTPTGTPARDDLGSPLYSDDIASKSRDRAHDDLDDDATTANDDVHDELDIIGDNGTQDAHVIDTGYASDLHLYKEAMSRSDAADWAQAFAEEMATHKRNGTWELVKCPPGVRPVDNRWVLKTKRHADGTIE